MRWYGLLAAGAALLMGTAGAAADGEVEVGAPEHEGVAAGSFDWSGLYAGIAGGWLWGEDEAFEIQTIDSSVNDGPLPYDTEGWALGGLIGFNMQHGPWVYGGELDVEYVDFSGEWSWGNGNGLIKEINVMGSLRGRVGFAHDRILGYAAGGLAVGNVEMEAFEGPPPVFTIADNEVAFGYTVGGGVDVAIWDSLVAGVEYRYTDLGDTEHNGEIFGDDFTYSHSNAFHAVRARLIWRMAI